jgi:predicted nucleotidyltransferase
MADLTLTKPSQAELMEILTNYKQELARSLGNKLEAVYLYGSQARGDARPGSDIDVLIVIREEFDYFEMLKKTSRLTADLSLQNNIVISRVFVTSQDFEQRKTPLLENIQRECIPL